MQLLTWLDRGQRIPQDVRLICIGSFPGRPSFKGLGELTPSELASLFESRAHVTEAEYLLAQRAWSAFRSADPRALEALLALDTSALPFLAAALHRYLEELPWVSDGLSRSERRLLELTAPGPLEIASAFPLMQSGEQAYYITDGSLRQMLEDLASEPSPLIRVDADFSVGVLPEGVVTISDAGREVLAGATDRVRLRGIDRWFGGVHLQGSGPVWRWDDSQQSIGRH